MTTTDSRFVLPSQTISAEELRRSMPKAQRLRTVKYFHSAPPSAELMAELRGLLRQLHPDDPHPDRSWMISLTIDELAERFNVSKETVRTQLKHVLTKTGTHRQADLVAQLGGIVKLDIGKSPQSDVT